MRPLFDAFESVDHVTTLDWLRFGALLRPRADWSPKILSAFLNRSSGEFVPGPHTLLAAGHAANYALYQDVYQPGTIERLVLVAPTRSAPFPTMMVGQLPWFGRLGAAVDKAAVDPHSIASMSV